MRLLVLINTNLLKTCHFDISPTLQFGCVVSSSADGRVKVWNQNGVEITSFQPHQSRINSCDLWAPGVNIEEMEQGKTFTFHNNFFFVYNYPDWLIHNRR